MPKNVSAALDILDSKSGVSMSELTEELIDFDAESELSLNVNVDWNIFVDYGMPNIWLYYISYGIFLSILRIFKGAEDVT